MHDMKLPNDLLSNIFFGFHVNDLFRPMSRECGEEANTCVNVPS